MRELSVIGPSRLRSASIVLALAGGMAQLAIAFMGLAIGGPGAGASLVLLSGAGALAATLSTTYFEIGPAILPTGAGALALATRRVS